ncbi:MAG: inositol monophosphatase [Candidatus Devosia phytovorans]|uniref:Inositol monophosphatase n=1 Tax=Candidatus Devosia phytovorans TaxID=3121372 RepID=A0AAJ5VYE3_9HYPH|nr:inositol monophosphatase [Devosia sp.]WEK06732.1 MAG: inositol monophosphatase [Devosia sp.]
MRHAAEKEIVPRFRNLGAGDINEKSSSIDLVTQADLGAEREITAALRDRYPTALIVGEEAYAADPSVMHGLAEAELAFVIDPVDGTFNFAAGNPLFGSILAVVANGVTVAGIIHDPLHDDTLVAELGSGAFLHRAGQQTSPIKVADPVPLSEMISVMSWSYLPQPARNEVAANMAGIRMSMAYGCSAYEYWMVATGRAHFLAANGMMPWDHLAGALIHQEAGGYNAHLDGTPYRPGQITGGLLCAPDRDSWTQIRQNIITPLPTH